MKNMREKKANKWTNKLHTVNDDDVYRRDYKIIKGIDEIGT